MFLSFNCPPDKFITVTLIFRRPHVEIAFNTNPFPIPIITFEIYRTLRLLQIYKADLQTLTISTLNGFLKQLTLLKTLLFAKTFYYSLLYPYMKVIIHCSPTFNNTSKPTIPQMTKSKLHWKLHSPQPYCENVSGTTAQIPFL